MAQPSAGGHAVSRLLVQHRVGSDSDAASRAFTQAGARLEKTIDALHVSVLSVPPGALNQISAALARTGLFTYVEPDYYASGAATTVTPNDPDYPSEWHLPAIQAPNGWAISEGSSAVPIAVIDSGVDATQPDLSSKLIAGWNFLTGTSNTSDDLGHGTAVAGAAAAASNNGVGVAGVAWKNPIMPLVVLDSTNYASYSNIASAITWAVQHGARILNISIGGNSPSSTLQNAVNYAWSQGAVIFASAMNNSSSTPYYPAACTNVVAVSATDVGGVLASFSNYGSWIDLSAPGNNILTTNQGGSYGYWWGTSFASPIAAAVAALALSVQPGLSNSALVTLLEQNSTDLGTPGWDEYFGYGQVNAYKAELAAQSAVIPQPPTVSITSPSPSSTVVGTVEVEGAATDNTSISSVQLFVDGQAAGTASGSPYSFAWNSAGVGNGSHTLSVQATNTAGNAGSAAVSITVNNPVVVDTQPPTATITQPANNSTVSGTVLISVKATDNVGVAQVSIYVDGVLKCTDLTAPYTCSWNTKKASSGSHKIAATAWDTSGNAGYATPVTVIK